MKRIATLLLVLVPLWAFAQDKQAAAPADAPTAAALAPAEAPPAPDAVAPDHARSCGAHRCGHGGGLVILGGVVGTVLTAVAVGVAVSFATQHNTPVR